MVVKFEDNKILFQEFEGVLSFKIQQLGIHGSLQSMQLFFFMFYDVFCGVYVQAFTSLAHFATSRMDRPRRVSSRNRINT